LTYPNKNEKFISLCKRFLQLVESLETISKAGIATLQHLESV